MNLPALQKTHLPEVLSKEEYDIVRQNYARDATDSEFAMFLGICKHLRLDPFKKEVYFAKIQGRVCVMTSIDSLRNKAIETGLWKGRTMPQFCGEDGVWKEIWPHKYPPFACKVGVKKIGFDEPQYAIAEWDAYAKQYNGKPTGNWATMGNHMLAKCAEALAIRIAFSNVTYGMNISEEMHLVKDALLPKIESKKLSVFEKDDIVNKINEKTAGLELEFGSEILSQFKRDMYIKARDIVLEKGDLDFVDYEDLATQCIPNYKKSKDLVECEEEAEEEVKNMEF